MAPRVRGPRGLPFFLAFYSKYSPGSTITIALGPVRYLRMPALDQDEIVVPRQSSRVQKLDTPKAHTRPFAGGQKPHCRTIHKEYFLRMQLKLTSLLVQQDVKVSYVSLLNPATQRKSYAVWLVESIRTLQHHVSPGVNANSPDQPKPDCLMPG